MNVYASVLTQSPLFSQISPEELSTLLRCLRARTAVYPKNAAVLTEGQSVTAVGFVVSGGVQIIREDFMGNRSIIAEIGRGNTFAEAFSCVQAQALPVTVISIAESEILWLDYWRIITSCQNSCRFHARLISNMLSIIAEKNIQLNQKLRHMSMRTIRDKLLAYLTDAAASQGSAQFEIPFNRQELADYLCVDRSAMSSALSKLQAEGILTYYKNRFCLNNAEPKRPAPRL